MALNIRIALLEYKVHYYPRRCYVIIKSHNDIIGYRNILGEQIYYVSKYWFMLKNANHGTNKDIFPRMNSKRSCRYLNMLKYA